MCLVMSHNSDYGKEGADAGKEILTDKAKMVQVEIAFELQ